jgi:hypothetical protein
MKKISLLFVLLLSSCSGNGSECTPECGQRLCGPDPVCGESCGVCGGDLECVEGTCTSGECCPGQDLHGWLSGRAVEFPDGSTLAISLAAVEAFDALQNPEPTLLSETNSDGTGQYQTGCVDLTVVNLRLLMLADDAGFDGLAGDWYPVFTAVLEVNTDEDRTCAEGVPDAWAVPNTLVDDLAAALAMPQLSENGFAIAFALDADGNPVQGATLELQSGGEVAGAVYPDETLSDFTASATSQSGVVLVPGPLDLVPASPVKDGLSWTPAPVVAVAGGCFVRAYRAD